MGSRKNADGGQAPYRIQSAYDAFRVLECLVMAPKPVTATQIAAEFREPRNRIFRLLKTLEESGYVVQDPDSRAYQPSLKLVSLGQMVARNRSLELVARPIMERLRDQTGETVYLVAREGEEAVCILNLESSHLVRISAQPGHRWPLGIGAAGQALLLGLPEPAQEAYLSRHPDIARNWMRVRERFARGGITYVDGREGTISDNGVMAIGTPVQNALGEVELALAVAWPIARADSDCTRFRKALEEGRRALARALGRFPDAACAERIKEVTDDALDKS